MGDDVPDCDDLLLVTLGCWWHGARYAHDGRARSAARRRMGCATRDGRSGGVGWHTAAQDAGWRGGEAEWGERTAAQRGEAHNGRAQSGRYF
jgi:hypothetical protein